jgi:hypothetical protein
MACIVLRSGASLTPAELGAFLTGQGDIGPRQHPRFVRVASQIPRTVTFKALTRVLAADRWNTPDPVWWRPDGRGRSPASVPLDAEQAAALDAAIGARLPSPSGRTARRGGTSGRSAGPRFRTRLAKRNKRRMAEVNEHDNW